MFAKQLEEETLQTKAVVAEANESRFKLQRQLSSLTKQAAGEKEFLEKKSAQLEKEKALAQEELRNFQLLQASTLEYRVGFCLSCKNVSLFVFFEE